MRKNYFLLALIVFISPALNAQRLKTEDFNYSLGQLTNLNGGANVSNNSWLTLSGTIKPVMVTEGNLTYPNYYTSPSGSAAHLHLDSSVLNTEDVYSVFDTIKDGTLYVSFLLRVNSLGNLALYDSANADYLAGLFSSNPAGQAFCRLYIKKGDIQKRSEEAASFRLGIDVRSYTNTPISWADADLLPDEVYLISMAYQIIEGPNNDIAKLWINQSFSETEPAPAASSVMTAESGTEPSNITRLAFRQAYAASIKAGTPDCDIDAIKISSSWIDGTLPLQLLSVNIINNNGYAKLKWQTCNEINVKHFEIQKSSDARNFSHVAIVAAKNGACSNNYSFSERKLLSGTNYYRIKMVDNDGRSTYSGIVSINENLATSINAFPNPARNNLTLSYPQAGNNAYLQIISLNGRDVLRQALEPGSIQTNVDVSTFSKGNYIAVFVNNGKKQTIKFVKQ